MYTLTCFPQYVKAVLCQCIHGRVLHIGTALNCEKGELLWKVLHSMWGGGTGKKQQSSNHIQLYNYTLYTMVLDVVIIVLWKLRKDRTCALDNIQHSQQVWWEVLDWSVIAMRMTGRLDPIERLKDTTCWIERREELAWHVMCWLATWKVRALLGVRGRCSWRLTSCRGAF